MPIGTYPIRILHIFGTMDRGGAEMRTVEVMRGIDRDRFQFEFCSMSGMPGDLDDEIRSLGGTVHYLKRAFSFPFRFRALLRRRKFDIVHSHVHHSSGFILRLAASEGVPGRIAHYRSTGTIGSFDQPPDGWLRNTFHWMMKRWVKRYATDILAVSKAAMTESWNPNWQSDPRCRIIYSGVQPFFIDRWKFVRSSVTSSELAAKNQFSFMSATQHRPKIILG